MPEDFGVVQTIIDTAVMTTGQSVNRHGNLGGDL